MRALILVGGKGTRLQPLTYTIPKPMVPVLNRPFLEHMIRWLQGNGVTEMILTTGYLPDTIRDYFGDGRDWGVRLSYVVEDEPLDTGGAIKNCQQMLAGEPFLVVNGDILTNLDLEGTRRLHEERKALVTVAASWVEDPRPFGMLVTDKAGRVREWVEKPQPHQVTSHYVNVGVFFLRADALEMMPEGRFNLERQFIAPAIQQGQPVYADRTDCYWLDIGTVAKYRQAHLDALGGKVQVEFPGREVAAGVWLSGEVEMGPGVRLLPPVVIGDGCRLGRGALVGPCTTLCRRVTVGPGARVMGSIVWSDATIGGRASVVDSVIGDRVRIRAGAAHREDVVGGARQDRDREG